MRQRTNAAASLVNLAALPATLIESELFGYEYGTFTGGRKQGQSGKLEQAEGGTLFLDEVGGYPYGDLGQVPTPGRLDRAESDFRIVAVTHRDLRELINSGRFRLDLFYRLSGVVLHVSALLYQAAHLFPANPDAYSTALSQDGLAGLLRCGEIAWGTNAI